MRFGHLEACLDHDTGRNHPESADRPPAIRDALADCVRTVHRVFDGYDPTGIERTPDRTVGRLVDEVRARGYPGL